MTRAEKIFWSCVRGGGYEIKFRRQVSIGPYIVDFYSPKNRIVVELDGESHDTDEAHKSDKERDAYMQSLGLHVLRFRNHEIINDIDSVLLRMKNSVSFREQDPPSLRRRGLGGGSL